MTRLLPLTALLLIFIITGCGGMVREEVLTSSEASNTRYATYNLNGADLMIESVVISQELKAVFGPFIIIPTFASEVEIINEPLTIKFLIFVKHGEAIIDLNTISVVINETGTHLPIKKEIERAVYLESGRRDYTWGPTFDAITLTARNIPYSFNLTFDIQREDVESFRLSFGDLIINGKPAIVKPVYFKRLFRTIGR